MLFIFKQLTVNLLLKVAKQVSKAVLGQTNDDYLLIFSNAYWLRTKSTRLEYDPLLKMDVHNFCNSDELKDLAPLTRLFHLLLCSNLYETDIVPVVKYRQ